MFSKRDLYLYSCGKDGSINQWETINWTRGEFLNKGPVLKCMQLSNK